MRLIDADKAEAVLRNIADHLKECGQDDLWPATYAAADIIKQQRTIDAYPCSFCVYGPPSSGDGKPCTMCPAEAKRKEGE